MSPEDIHAPYLAPLIAADDWAALARYWIAHRHEPALAAAIVAAHRLAIRDSRWAELPAYLEKVRVAPFDTRIEPPEPLLALDGGAARGTLTILFLIPRVALCEMAGPYPPGQQEWLFHVAQHAAQEALAVSDTALRAFFIGVLACGLWEVGQWKNAEECYTQAVTLYRELAIARPEVYRPDVAMTLNNLGTVQRVRNDPEAALASFGEGLRIYSELPLALQEAYRPNVATTLNNLGTAQRDLSDLEAARESFEKSLQIHRKLAKARPDLYRPDVAISLNNLGNVLRDLKDLKNLKAARKCFEESLQIRRALPKTRPNVYWNYVAGSLNNLGNVQRDLDELEAARESFKESVQIRRELADVQPAVYRPAIARTLNNLV